MNLTKEDLAAIRGIVKEEIKMELAVFEVKMDEKFEVLREGMRQLLKAFKELH